MIAFTIPGEPVAFARAGALGKRRFTPKKQANFMAIARSAAADAMEAARLTPMDGPLRVIVRAEYLLPASWSKKKQAAARWKASKPDADNIAKILKDSMNKIVYRDDAQIAELIVQKIYGINSRVTVTVEMLEAHS